MLRTLKRWAFYAAIGLGTLGVVIGVALFMQWEHGWGLGVCLLLAIAGIAWQIQAVERDR